MFTSQFSIHHSLKDLKEFSRRITIEQINNLSRSLSLFITEISLEYIMFSKIKNRRSLHHSAIYSFFQTFAGKNAKRNIRITLGGYQNALQELIGDDNPPIEIIMHAICFS